MKEDTPKSSIGKSSKEEVQNQSGNNSNRTENRGNSPVFQSQFSFFNNPQPIEGNQNPPQNNEKHDMSFDGQSNRNSQIEPLKEPRQQSFFPSNPGKTQQESLDKSNQ